MKKLILIFMVLFLAVVFIACDDTSDDTSDRPKSIDVTIESEVMEVGEEQQLTAKVNPSTASQEVVWSTSDESVLEIADQTGKVKAVAAGVADIIVTSKADNRLNRKVTIAVNVPIVYDDPESIVFTSTRAEVGVNFFITVVAEVHPLTAKQEVVWSSSNENIATVNENGRVTGHSLGIVEITATAVADTSIFAVYSVSVVDREDISDTNPSEIIITGENNVIEGHSILLTADVHPQGASLTVFWTSEDPSVATVSENGTVTGLKPGETFIIATSAVDTSVSKAYKFTVKPEPFNEPRPDLKNYTITVLASQGHEDEHDPFLDTYMAADKLAKQQAWLEVEDLYNCKIVVTEFPTTAAWGGPRISWVNTNASTNTHTADIMVLTTEWISQLANGNSVVDVTKYYEDYGRNQMPTAMRQASTLHGKMYALLRSAPGSIYVDQGLFYNVNLVEELGLESPAAIFNRGEWTFSEFKNYAIAAKSVMNEEQSVFSGKTSLYWIGMTNASGVKLLDTNTLQVNFHNQYARLAATTLRDIYLSVGWGTNHYDELVESFTEGKSIFQSGEYWFIRDPSRWGKDMWGEGTTKFGYVPYPRADQVSKEDTRINGGDGECYMMVTGVGSRPSYVTEAAIYRAWSDLIINTATIMQEDPNFNEDIAMKRTAEFQLDDPSSLDAATFFKRDKLIFDPSVYGIVNYSYISPHIDSVVFNGEDYTQVMDTHIGHYRSELERLYG
ncbi:MAG: extracellular solute-binding protein [Bacilli bacterium]|nr:extracellular solute-binding protein [Bacilli bacterium]